MLTLLSPLPSLRRFVTRLDPCRPSPSSPPSWLTLTLLSLPLPLPPSPSSLSLLVTHLPHPSQVRSKTRFFFLAPPSWPKLTALFLPPLPPPLPSQLHEGIRQFGKDGQALADTLKAKLQ